MASLSQLSELMRTFVPPAGLGRSRPRDVRLSRAGRAMVALAIMLVIGAIAAMVGLSREASRQAETRAALVERGVLTMGEVTRLWASGDNRRKVVYRFQAEGLTFTGDIKVSAERRRGLDVGMPIAVRFLPGNPEVNDLGGRPRAGMPAALAPIVAFALGTGGALCLISIRLQRRLLEQGRVAPAIVTGHHTSRSQHGKHHSMTYAFQLPSGAAATGKSGTSSRPPAVGSVITVIYDPERPARSKVYPLSLVRPA